MMFYTMEFRAKIANVNEFNDTFLGHWQKKKKKKVISSLREFLVFSLDGDFRRILRLPLRF